MKSVAALGAFSALLLLQGTPNYGGRYLGHPNLPQVLAAVTTAKDEARTEIPKRLGVPYAELPIKLLDLDKPENEPAWPPRFNWRGDRAGLGRGNAEVALNADYFVGDPSLVRAAFLREAARYSLTMENKDQLSKWAFEGAAKGLLDGLCSQFAKTHELEVNYAICRALIAREPLEGMVGEIEAPPPPKNPREFLRGEPTVKGKLTILYAAKLLTSKGGGEKSYGEMVSGLLRGNTIESVIKKATGKTLDQFNGMIVAEHKAYVTKAVPKADLDLYKKIAEGVEKSAFEPALAAADEFLKKSPGSILAGSVHYLRGKALLGLKKPEAPDAFRAVLGKHRSLTPYAKDAQAALAQLAMDAGDKDRAKAEFDRLRDDFGWSEEARALAQASIEKLK